MRGVKRTPEQTHQLKEELTALSSLIGRQSEDPEVRRSLVHVLGGFGNLAQGLVPSLLKILRNDQDDEVTRATIVMIVPYIGPTERVRPRHGCHRQPQSHVRVNALQALDPSAFGLDMIVPMLFRLANDEVPQIRLSAVDHAAAIYKKDQRVATILIAALHDQDQFVRETAVQTLGALGAAGVGAQTELLSFALR